MSINSITELSDGPRLEIAIGTVLASAQRELSEALMQSQGYVYRSCALLIAKASGRQVLPLADTPFLD
jgi:hypothetical protein